MGLGNGLVGLFKQWGKGIGNAADHVWLREEAQKAIKDEVTKKFQPRIDRANTAESRRATNIKDLGDKITQSKEELANARKAWQEKYDNALADAKTKRQTDIADYDAKLKGYQDALDNANRGKQDLLDQLSDSEAHYDPSHTIFTDVTTGENYIFDLFKGGYRSLNNLSKKERKEFRKNYGNFDTRLFDNKTGKVINAFDESNINNYKGNAYFDNYYSHRISTQNAALRDADNQITRANSDLTNWKNNNRPADWDDTTDLKPFNKDFKSNNGAKPNEYSFNGQNYSKESDLDKAYREALAREKSMQSRDSRIASGYVSRRDAEIAQRIQDAKDINKAKIALGGTLGAGALYAGARAMYGGDNTDNTDTIDNVRPDPNFNIKNTPEVQAQLNDEQQPDTAPINTGFDPDKADALAAAAYDKGVEDGNSIESSGDLGNNIAAKTGGHTIDDGLFELLKAMENPYKADAIADYIYSRYGNDPDVQRLGWRGWLNKYYGDSLRSNMNIDPSGYNGMHIA